MKLRQSERKNVKIKMALQSISSGGKTYSSLLLAKKSDPNVMSRFAGGCLLSSLVSANPILMPIAAEVILEITNSKHRKILSFVIALIIIVAGISATINSKVKYEENPYFYLDTVSLNKLTNDIQIRLIPYH